MTVYVSIDGNQANQVSRPQVPYALRYTHGYVRAGIADRRGAVVDPAARGPYLELRKPAGTR